MALRELAIWFLAVLVAARIAEGVHTSDGIAWAEAIGSHNLIYFLAYAAVLSRFWRIEERLQAQTTDVVVFLAAAGYLVMVSPLSLWLLDGLAALLLGCYLLSKRQQDQNLSAAAIVLFALGAHLFVGRIVMLAFQSQIVVIDAFLVQHALWLTGETAPRVENSLVSENGFAIAIIGACSAFNNITLVMLAIVSAIAWIRPRLYLSDIRWLVWGALTMLAINTFRLGLLAQSLESYRYWHNGVGNAYFEAAQTAVVLLIAYLASHQRRPGAVVQ